MFNTHVYSVPGLQWSQMWKMLSLTFQAVLKLYLFSFIMWFVKQNKTMQKSGNIKIKINSIKYQCSIICQNNHRKNFKQPAVLWESSYSHRIDYKLCHTIYYFVFCWFNYSIICLGKCPNSDLHKWSRYHVTCNIINSIYIPALLLLTISAWKFILPQLNDTAVKWCHKAIFFLIQG